MTTRKKLVIGTLVALIPLGLFAHDKYNDRDSKGFDRDHDAHERFFDDDGHELHEKFFGNVELFKEANYEFEGKLESRPKNGFNGVWKISGMEVTVDDKTLISHDRSLIKVGDEIEVLAKRENGKITALVLEQD